MLPRDRSPAPQGQCGRTRGPVRGDGAAPAAGEAPLLPPAAAKQLAGPTGRDPGPAPLPRGAGAGRPAAGVPGGVARARSFSAPHLLARRPADQGPLRRRRPSGEDGARVPGIRPLGPAVRRGPRRGAPRRGWDELSARSHRPGRLMLRPMANIFAVADRDAAFLDSMEELLRADSEFAEVWRPAPGWVAATAPLPESQPDGEEIRGRGFAFAEGRDR